MKRPTEAPLGTPRPKPAAVRRILVADDSVDVAESVGMLLELRGHQVYLAHTGRDAIAASRAHQPDVVLLDIGLPDMSGFDVARLIREAPLPVAPVLVAVTGYGRDADRQRAREAGIDHLLTKPVEPATLMKLLGSLAEPGSGRDGDGAAGA